ncbi:MAG: hypothetical protein CBE46_000040 [Candidatus Pelagibacter sp. TMED286]|nr:MAG: hypothetical protein CBE46_000040 [Candidatus Pelagibacter sp. TMED286]
MHKFIEKIKKFESKPFVVSNFLNEKEVRLFQELYENLPIEINNERQKIIKKKWSTEFNVELQKKYIDKLRECISDYEMDNPETKEGSKSLGLFQESYMPVTLHVDTGFDFEKIIYKQTLLPLSEIGETVIFKNRFYGCSTTFSIDPNELAAKGYNKRSSAHLNLYGDNEFDKEIHKKYLTHENINNLKGLEVEMIFKWKLGDLLIFDRSNLHCSSKNINKKKIGFTSSTKKL